MGGRRKQSDGKRKKAQRSACVQVRGEKGRDR